MKRRSSRSISESQRFSRTPMKNKSFGPLVATLVLVFLLAVYAYLFNENYRQEKKILALQAKVFENSQSVSAVIGYINNSLSEAQAQVK